MRAAVFVSHGGDRETVAVLLMVTVAAPVSLVIPGLLVIR